jgi:hypothetical protein
MAREEFFQSVREAVRFAAPTVDIYNVYTDPKALAKVLRRTAQWLNPNSVKGFQPQDYKDLPPAQQQELTDAVAAFLELAERFVRSPAVATFEVIGGFFRLNDLAAEVTDHPSMFYTAREPRKALPHFLRIIKIVQELIRAEWLGAVNKLVGDAEVWSASRHWITKRDDKEIAEDFLGTYVAPRLLIAKNASRLVLEPVARFVPGATGLADFAVLPSYDSVLISRTNHQWHVSPGEGHKPRPWSEATFQDLANRLSKRR